MLTTIQIREGVTLVIDITETIDGPCVTLGSPDRKLAGEEPGVYYLEPLALDDRIDQIRAALDDGRLTAHIVPAPREDYAGGDPEAMAEMVAADAEPFYPVVTIDGEEWAGGIVWGMDLAAAIYDSLFGGQFDDISDQINAALNA